MISKQNVIWFETRCLVIRMENSWGTKSIGFNIEYGELENGELKWYFKSKILPTVVSKEKDSKLEFNLENGFLENAVGN